MDENKLMAEFANNLWDNFISKKVSDMMTDSVTYYRAKVTANSYATDGMITIKKPFETARKIKCTKGMASVTIGTQVMVLRFGSGNMKNEIAFANGNGTEISKIDSIYPVGSIYMSTNSTNPSTLFGGTWVAIEDRFLLGASSTYPAGVPNGEATVTLTENQIPSHVHEEQLHIQNEGTVTMRGGSATGETTFEISSTGGRGTNGTGEIVTTKTTGGGQAHNNMPPYLPVYIWKRTN